MDETGDEDTRELIAAREHRRESDRQLTMSERLAAVHELCLQVTAVAGSVKQK